MQQTDIRKRYNLTEDRARTDEEKLNRIDRLRGALAHQAASARSSTNYKSAEKAERNRKRLLQLGIRKGKKKFHVILEGKFRYETDVVAEDVDDAGYRAKAEAQSAARGVNLKQEKVVSAKEWQRQP